jgi:deoxyribose-phosphate aldolase
MSEAENKFRRPVHERLFSFITLFFFFASLFFEHQGSLHAARPGDVSLQVPISKDLGEIQEIYRGKSDKTIYYIQDAHSSVEAQYNIASLIQELVKKRGIRLVFEEGYEGRVPTDEYFSEIQDPGIKAKVSAYFLEQLRLGGAEYAHINRNQISAKSKDEKSRQPLKPVQSVEWRLVGVDSMRLHRENIEWYRKAAEQKDAVAADLASISGLLKELLNQKLSKDFQKWSDEKYAFEGGRLPLEDYLKNLSVRVRNERPAGDREEFPNLLAVVAGLKDPASTEAVFGKVKADALWKEIGAAEKKFVEGQLTVPRDRELYRLWSVVQKTLSLNKMEIASEEFGLFSGLFDRSITNEIASFAAQEKRQAVILSKLWEKLIESALKFYETALERDEVLKRHLEDFARSEKEDKAILVYGGFHRAGIQKILRDLGISYAVFSPKISQTSLKHEELYCRLMQQGVRGTEGIPYAVSTASRAWTLFESSSGRSEILRVYDLLRSNRALTIDDLALRMTSEKANGSQSLSFVSSEKQDARPPSVGQGSVAISRGEVRTESKEHDRADVFQASWDRKPWELFSVEGANAQLFEEYEYVPRQVKAAFDKFRIIARTSGSREIRKRMLLYFKLAVLLNEGALLFMRKTQLKSSKGVVQGKVWWFQVPKPEDLPIDHARFVSVTVKDFDNGSKAAINVSVHSGDSGDGDAVIRLEYGNGPFQAHIHPPVKDKRFFDKDLYHYQLQALKDRSRFTDYIRAFAQKMESMSSITGRSEVRAGAVSSGKESQAPREAGVSIFRSEAHDEKKNSAIDMTPAEAVRFVDYTLLSKDDPQKGRALREAVMDLVMKAQTYWVGGICVFPEHLGWVKGVGSLPMERASAVAFPEGLGATTVEQAIEGANVAIENGAIAITVVLNYRAVLSWDFARAEAELRAFQMGLKRAHPDVKLTTILEAAAFANKDPALIRRAAQIALPYSDFLQISTDMHPAGGATLWAAGIMLEEIRSYYNRYGRLVGFKPAGGIDIWETDDPAAKDGAAKEYFRLASTLMGRNYLRPETFRICSQGLLTDLLSRSPRVYLGGNVENMKGRAAEDWRRWIDPMVRHKLKGIPLDPIRAPESPEDSEAILQRKELKKQGAWDRHRAAIDAVIADDLLDVIETGQSKGYLLVNLDTQVSTTGTFNEMIEAYKRNIPIYVVVKDEVSAELHNMVALLSTRIFRSFDHFFAFAAAHSDLAQPVADQIFTGDVTRVLWTPKVHAVKPSEDPRGIKGRQFYVTSQIDHSPDRGVAIRLGMKNMLESKGGIVHVPGVDFTHEGPIESLIMKFLKRVGQWAAFRDLGIKTFQRNIRKIDALRSAPDKKAGAMIAFVDEENRPSGTFIDMWEAYVRGIPIYLILKDQIPIENQNSWMLNLATRVFRTEEELMEYLKNFPDSELDMFYSGRGEVSPAPEQPPSASQSAETLAPSFQQTFPQLMTSIDVPVEATDDVSFMEEVFRRGVGGLTLPWQQLEHFRQVHQDVEERVRKDHEGEKYPEDFLIRSLQKLNLTVVAEKSDVGEALEEARRIWSSQQPRVQVSVSLQSFLEGKDEVFRGELDHLSRLAGGPALLTIPVRMEGMTRAEKISMAGILREFPGLTVKLESASPEDVELFGVHLAGKCRMFVPGIRDFEEAKAMVAAGALGLSTRHLAEIVEGYRDFAVRDPVRLGLQRFESLLEEPLGLIRGEQARKAAIEGLALAPSTIWEAPGSETGKYHSVDESVLGGQTKHIKKVALITAAIADAWELSFDEKDILLVAALHHDLAKYGVNEDDYYRDDTRRGAFSSHPVLLRKITGDLERRYSFYKKVLEICAVHAGKYGRKEWWGATDRLAWMLHLADMLASRRHTIEFEKFILFHQQLVHSGLSFDQALYLIFEKQDQALGLLRELERPGRQTEEEAIHAEKTRQREEGTRKLLADVPEKAKNIIAGVIDRMIDRYQLSVYQAGYIEAGNLKDAIGWRDKMRLHLLNRYVRVSDPIRKEESGEGDFKEGEFMEIRKGLLRNYGMFSEFKRLFGYVINADLILVAGDGIADKGPRSGVKVVVAYLVPSDTKGGGGLYLSPGIQTYGTPDEIKIARMAGKWVIGFTPGEPRELYNFELGFTHDVVRDQEEFLAYVDRNKERFRLAADNDLYVGTYFENHRWKNHHQGIIPGTEPRAIVGKNFYIGASTEGAADRGFPIREKLRKDIQNAGGVVLDPLVRDVRENEKMTQTKHSGLWTLFRRFFRNAVFQNSRLIERSDYVVVVIDPKKRYVDVASDTLLAWIAGKPLYIIYDGPWRKISDWLTGMYTKKFSSVDQMLEYLNGKDIPDPEDLASFEDRRNAYQRLLDHEGEFTRPELAEIHGVAARSIFHSLDLQSERPMDKPEELALQAGFLEKSLSYLDSEKYGDTIAKAREVIIYYRSRYSGVRSEMRAGAVSSVQEGQAATEDAVSPAAHKKRQVRQPVPVSSIYSAWKTLKRVKRFQTEKFSSGEFGKEWTNLKKKEPFSSGTVGDALKGLEQLGLLISSGHGKYKRVGLKTDDLLLKKIETVIKLLSRRANPSREEIFKARDEIDLLRGIITSIPVSKDKDAKKSPQKSLAVAGSLIRTLRHIYKRIGTRSFTLEESRGAVGGNTESDTAWSVTKMREKLTTLVKIGVLTMDREKRPFRYRLTEPFARIKDEKALDDHFPKDDLIQKTDEEAIRLIREYIESYYRYKEEDDARRKGDAQTEESEPDLGEDDFTDSKDQQEAEIHQDIVNFRQVRFADSQAKVEFMNWVMRAKSRQYSTDEHVEALKAIKSMVDKKKIHRFLGMRGLINMHMHSYFSDGKYSPAFLVLVHYMHGYGAISITDHNTFDHWPESIRAAQALGQAFVPGAEIDTLIREKSNGHYLRYHELIYYVGNDTDDTEANAFLDDVLRWEESTRGDPTRKMIGKVRNIDIEHTKKILALHNARNPSLALTPEQVILFFGGSPLIKKDNIGRAVYFFHSRAGSGNLPPTVKSHKDVVKKYLDKLPRALGSGRREWVLFVEDLMAFKKRYLFIGGPAHPGQKPSKKKGWSILRWLEHLARYIRLPDGRPGYSFVEDHPSTKDEEREELDRGLVRLNAMGGGLVTIVGDDVHRTFNRKFGIAYSPESKSGQIAMKRSIESLGLFHGSTRVPRARDILLNWADIDLVSKINYPVAPRWGLARELGKVINGNMITASRQVVQALVESVETKESSPFDVALVLRTLLKDPRLDQSDGDRAFVKDLLGKLEKENRASDMRETIRYDHESLVLEDLLTTVLIRPELAGEFGFTRHELEKSHKQYSIFPTGAYDLPDCLLELVQQKLLVRMKQGDGQVRYRVQRMPETVFRARTSSRAADPNVLEGDEVWTHERMVLIHPKPGEGQEEPKRFEHDPRVKKLPKDFEKKDVKNYVAAFVRSMRPGEVLTVEAKTLPGPRYGVTYFGLGGVEKPVPKEVARVVRMHLGEDRHVVLRRIPASVAPELSKAALEPESFPPQAEGIKTVGRYTHYISPSFLLTLMTCVTRAYNEVHDPIKDWEPPLFLRMLFENGISHEQKIVLKIAKEIQYLDLRTEKPNDLDHRAWLTQKAMKDGVKLIYQGVLFDHARQLKGSPDFLLCTGKTRAGHYRYVPIDAKSGRAHDLVNITSDGEVIDQQKRQKRTYAIQLAEYVDMLVAMGHQDPLPSNSGGDRKDNFEVDRSVGIITTVQFQKADPEHGLEVYESLVKQGVLEEVNPGEVRLKQDRNGIFSRPQELAGDPYNEIWERLIDPVSAGVIDVYEGDIAFSRSDLYIHQVSVDYDMGKYWGPHSKLTYWQLYEAALVRAREIKNAKTNEKGDLDPDDSAKKPALSSICPLCPFFERCRKWAEEHDDPSLLTGIARAMRDSLHYAGIRTVHDLAHMSIDHILKLKNAKVRGFSGKNGEVVEAPDSSFLYRVGKRKLTHAKESALAREHNVIIIHKPLHLLLDKLIRIQDDIETIPFPLRAIVYMHGFFREDSRPGKPLRQTGKYVVFTAKKNAPKEEKRVMKQRWQWLRMFPRALVALYHYSAFERWNMEKLAQLYPDVISVEQAQGYYNGIVSAAMFKHLAVDPEKLLSDLQGESNSAAEDGNGERVAAEDEDGALVGSGSKSYIRPILRDGKPTVEYAVQKTFRDLKRPADLRIPYSEEIKEQAFNILKASRFASDLYLDVVYPNTFWPFKGKGLKPVAQYFGFEWDVEDPGGAKSIVMIEKLWELKRKQAAGEDLDPRELEEVERWNYSYNKGDNMATAFLVHAFDYILNHNLKALEAMRRLTKGTVRVDRLERVVLLEEGQTIDDVDWSKFTSPSHAGTDQTTVPISAPSSAAGPTKEKLTQAENPNASVELPKTVETRESVASSVAGSLASEKPVLPAASEVEIVHAETLVPAPIEAGQQMELWPSQVVPQFESLPQFDTKDGIVRHLKAMADEGLRIPILCVAPGTASRIFSTYKNRIQKALLFRKFPKENSPRYILIYVTEEKYLAGMIRVRDTANWPIDEIAKIFPRAARMTEKEIRKYFEGSEDGTVVNIEKASPFAAPLSLEDLRTDLGVAGLSGYSFLDRAIREGEKVSVSTIPPRSEMRTGVPAGQELFVDTAATPDGITRHFAAKRAEGKKLAVLFSAGGGQDNFSIIPAAQHLESMGFEVLIYGVLGFTPYHYDSKTASGEVESPIIRPSSTLKRKIMTRTGKGIKITEKMIPEVMDSIGFHPAGYKLLSPKIPPPVLARAVKQDVEKLCRDKGISPREVLLSVVDFGGDALASGESTVYSVELDAMMIQMAKLLPVEYDKTMLLFWPGVDGELAPEVLRKKVAGVKASAVTNPKSLYLEQSRRSYEQFIAGDRRSNTLPISLDNLTLGDSGPRQVEVVKKHQVGAEKVLKRNLAVLDPEMSKRAYLFDLGAVIAMNPFARIEYNDLLEYFIKIMEVLDRADMGPVESPYQVQKRTDFHLQYLGLDRNGHWNSRDPNPRAILHILMTPESYTPEEMKGFLEAGFGFLAKGETDLALISPEQFRKAGFDPVPAGLITREAGKYIILARPGLETLASETAARIQNILSPVLPRSEMSLPHTHAASKPRSFILYQANTLFPDKREVLEEILPQIQTGTIELENIRFQRLKRLIEDIRSSGASLVTLQEVNFHLKDPARHDFKDRDPHGEDGDYHTARIAAAALGFRYMADLYTKLRPHEEGDPVYRTGNAILYDPAVVDMTSPQPLRFQDSAIRSVLGGAFRMKSTGDEFMVFTTHLRAAPHKQKERRRQLRGVQEAIRQFNPSGLPVILTGDFNPADNNENQQFFQRVAKKIPPVLEGFQDVFELLAPGVPNDTFRNSNPLVQRLVTSLNKESLSIPDKRTMHVHIHGKGIRPMDIQVREYAGEDGGVISDHNPVAAQFAFEHEPSRKEENLSHPLPAAVLTPEDIRKLTPVYPSAEAFLKDRFRHGNDKDTVFLTFLRHANSTSNFYPYTQGPATFSPLTLWGLLQRYFLKKFLLRFKVPFDRIVSSPYERTLSTVEPVVKASGKNLEIDGALREIDIYEPFEGVPRKQVQPTLDALGSLFLQDPERYEAGGFRTSDRLAGVERFLRQIESGGAESVLAASHGTAIFIAVFKGLGIDTKKIGEAKNRFGDCPAAGLTTLAYHKKTGTWELLVLADDSFIPEGLRRPFRHSLIRVAELAWMCLRIFLRSIEKKMGWSAPHGSPDYWPGPDLLKGPKYLALVNASKVSLVPVSSPSSLRSEARTADQSQAEKNEEVYVLPRQAGPALLKLIDEWEDKVSEKTGKEREDALRALIGTTRFEHSPQVRKRALVALGRLVAFSEKGGKEIAERQDVAEAFVNRLKWSDEIDPQVQLEALRYLSPLIRKAPQHATKERLDLVFKWIRNRDLNDKNAYGMAHFVFENFVKVNPPLAREGTYWRSLMTKTRYAASKKVRENRIGAINAFMAAYPPLKKDPRLAGVMEALQAGPAHRSEMRTEDFSNWPLVLLGAGALATAYLFLWWIRYITGILECAGWEVPWHAGLHDHWQKLLGGKKPVHVQPFGFSGRLNAFYAETKDRKLLDEFVRDHVAGAYLWKRVKEHLMFKVSDEGVQVYRGLRTQPDKYLSMKAGRVLENARRALIQKKKNIFWKNGTLLVISDVHLGGGDKHDYQSGLDYEMVALLEQAIERNAMVVINGDFLELLKYSYGDIKRAHPTVFDALRRVQKILYVPGNHDEAVLDEHLDWLHREELAAARKHRIHGEDVLSRELQALALGVAPGTEVLLTSSPVTGGAIFDENQNVYFVSHWVLDAPERDKVLARVLRNARENLNAKILADLSDSKNPDRLIIARYALVETSAGMHAFEHGHVADRINFDSPIGRWIVFTVDWLQRRGLSRMQFLLETNIVSGFIPRWMRRYVPGYVLFEAMNEIQRMFQVSRMYNWTQGAGLTDSVRRLVAIGHTHTAIDPGAGVTNVFLAGFMGWRFMNSGSFSPMAFPFLNGQAQKARGLDRFWITDEGIEYQDGPVVAPSAVRSSTKDEAPRLEIPAKLTDFQAARSSADKRAEVRAKGPEASGKTATDRRPQTTINASGLRSDFVHSEVPKTKQEKDLTLAETLRIMQVPVMLHISVEDLLGKFSPSQRQELLIAAYFSNKVHLAIYGAGQVDSEDPRIRPFRQLVVSKNRNVRIYASGTEGAAARTQSEFVKGWTRWVNVGLEKSEGPGTLSAALEKIKGAKWISFRYLPSEERSGLVTKALELAQAALLEDNIPAHVLARLSITSLVGGFTLESRYLADLQSAIFADFAVAGAA